MNLYEAVTPIRATKQKTLLSEQDESHAAGLSSKQRSQLQKSDIHLWARTTERTCFWEPGRLTTLSSYISVCISAPHAKSAELVPAICFHTRARRLLPHQRIQPRSQGWAFSSSEGGRHFQPPPCSILPTCSWKTETSEAVLTRFSHMKHLPTRTPRNSEV